MGILQPALVRKGDHQMIVAYKSLNEYPLLSKLHTNTGHVTVISPVVSL